MSPGEALRFFHLKTHNLKPSLVNSTVCRRPQTFAVSLKPNPPGFRLGFLPWLGVEFCVSVFHVYLVHVVEVKLHCGSSRAECTF